MTRLFTADAAAGTRQQVDSPDRRGTTILAPKLSPPEPAHATVLRPRLFSLLTRAAQRAPLTLLSGPAGSGKTTLAASWRHGHARDGPSGG